MSDEKAFTVALCVAAVTVVVSLLIGSVRGDIEDSRVRIECIHAGRSDCMKDGRR